MERERERMGEREGAKERAIERMGQYQNRGQEANDGHVGANILPDRALTVHAAHLHLGVGV